MNTLFRKLKEKKEERIDVMFGESPRKKLYLVAMEGEPLGAFYLEKNAFHAISGKDYFNLLGSLPEVSLSYYAVDPVFAKCLLIPSQNKPAYRGGINGQELKKKIDILKNDQNENMILLRNQNEVSFFYFKYGKGVESYFHHPDKRPAEKEIGDQFLVYVLSHDLSLLTMEIYHNARVIPLLEHPLTKDDVAGGIIEHFLNQKPKPTSADKMDFEPDSALFLFDSSPPVSGQNSAGESFSPKGKGKWYLELVGGEQMGRRVVLNKPRLTIGRMKADLMLGDVKISRQHAIIELTDQGYRLTDLGSSNGSFVNGQSIKTQLLKPADIIRVGGTLIKILVE
ncbi:MAG: FHA domain-containing protein [Nitrospirae bacterium]|nr:FHA domain-containing protein [Nitrospirota bacterium]